MDEETFPSSVAAPEGTEGILRSMSNKDGPFGRVAAASASKAQFSMVCRCTVLVVSSN